MNKLKLTQIRATREAGTVRRCHIVPHHGQYNIAQHSYGAVSLLLLLHPDPSLNLIKAVQWHDVGERWLGDMPAPAKFCNPELGAIYEATEEQLLKSLQLLPELTEEETSWLKAVDTLELLLWCREESSLGNKTVEPMLRVCTRILEERIMDGTLPGPAAEFYLSETRHEPKRLSDFFGEVLDGLEEADAGLG